MLVNKSNVSRIESHPWRPFYPPDVRLLILGSFPPPSKRWSMEFYYPNWINDFWRILGTIFFDDIHHFELTGRKAFDEKLIKTFLTDKKIGMNDMGKKAIRLKDNASDRFLEIVEAINLIDTFGTLPKCRGVVTTGQKSSDIFTEQIREIACHATVPGVGEWVEISLGSGRSVRWYRMPSTSRAYPKPLAEKAQIWRRMFQEMKLV